MAATLTKTPAQLRAAGDWQGAAAHATEASIHRMVAVIVPLWMVAIGTNVVIQADVDGIGVVIACAAAVLIAHATFLLARTALLLCVVLGLTAMLVGFAGPPVTSASVFPLIVLWLNMATTVTGALVRGRPGMAAVVVVSAAGGFAVARGNPVDPLFLSGIVAQGLVGGLCMWAGIDTLRQSAAARDRAAVELHVTQTLASSEAARIHESRRMARALHDTVINTLGAIRALPISDVDALRARCRADLDVLGHTPDLAPSTSELLTRLEHRAKVLGLHMEVRATGAGPLPGPLAEALEGAIGEALLNTAKHSGSREVHLRWSWDGRTGWAEVADSGVGLRGRTLSGGAAESILGRCAEAGIDVRTYDRDGAVVRFDWSAAAQVAERRQRVGVPVPTGPMLGLAAARVGIVMAAFGAYSTLATPAGTGRVGSALSVLVVLAVVAWAVLNQRQVAPSRLPVLLYALAVGAATILPGIGMQGCSRIGWYWWGPLAGLVVLIAIALIDGRGWAVSVSAAAYVGAFWIIFASTSGLTGSCTSETVSIVILDLGIVLAIQVLRRALVAQSAAAEESRRQTSRVSLQMAGLAARDEVRRRDLVRALSLCRPLLEGIAEGTLDPLDPVVRASAGRAESTLRALNSLPPELGDFSSSLADRVFAAAGRGVELEVSCQGGTRPTPEQSRAATAVIDQWLAGLPGGGHGRITLLGLGDETLVMLTGPAGPQFPLPPCWVRSDDDGATLLETAWSGRSAEPDDQVVEPSMSPSRRASR